MVEAMATVAPLVDAWSGISAGSIGTSAFSGPAVPQAGAFERVIGQVEQAEGKAASLMEEVATGKVDSLHQVMLGMEEARMRFELFLQARNRVLEAYQEVMRMQV